MNKYIVFPVVIIVTLLLGCDQSQLREEERRNLRTVNYIAFIESNIEHASTLDALLESGEIEKAQNMIRMGMFLDLIQLDQIVSADFQDVLGDPVPRKPLKEVENKVKSLHEKFFTEGVEEAGERYASLPSEIGPILESREFLEKMKQRGLPTKNPE